MYKTCNHCNTENFASAKYCVGCNNQIGQPVQSVIAQGIPSKPRGQRKQTYVYDEMEYPEDLVQQELEVANVSLVETLLNHVESKMDKLSRKGIKFEDAITIKPQKSGKTGLKESKKAIKKAHRAPQPEIDSRSGGQILQELGGNDPRLERDFKK